MSAATVLSEVSIVDEHVRAFSRRDWEQWRKTVAPNAVYREYATNRTTVGAEAIIAELQTWVAAFPDITGTVTNTIAEGDKVALEITWTGTHAGPINGLTGVMPPTGRRGQVHAVELFTFQGDRIAEMHHYFDLMELTRGLGAGPP